MLLTLDLSTSIGWTCGRPADPNFKYAAHRLPSTGNDIGEFAKSYNEWLRGMIFQHRGVLTSEWLVVFEAPVLPKQTSLITVRKLSGLAWHTEYVCKDLGIECAEAHLQNVKKYVTGKGNAKKDQMVAAIRGLGFFLPHDKSSEDQADAIGVRLYTLSERWPELRTIFNFGLGPLERKLDEPDNTEGELPPI